MSSVLEGARDLQRRRQLPQRVVLEHDVDALADGGADRLDQPDRAAEILRVDVLAGARQRVGVERPDLHRGDAVLEQRERELARALVLRGEVVVGRRAAASSGRTRRVL